MLYRDKIIETARQYAAEIINKAQEEAYKLIQQAKLTIREKEDKADEENKKAKEEYSVPASPRSEIRGRKTQNDCFPL